MLTKDQLAELAKKAWYYQIELAEGLVTPGRSRANLALIRDFIRRTELDGASCLDIGTQEFVCPVLMLRQGAKAVTAYDRLSLADRYTAIQQVYGVQFRYLHGLPLHDLRSAMQAQGMAVAYDFVNFSGVMYHMVDPLPGLAMARSFVREGGVLLLETAVFRSDDFSCAFNHHGELYPGSNYFLVSTTALDYWLRMLRLQVIDCGYFGDEKVGRLAAVCRATSGVVAELQDKWMREHWIWKDFEPFGLHFDELRSDAGPVGYRPSDQVRRVMHAEIDSVDIHATIGQSEVFPYDQQLTQLRLRDCA